MSDLKEYKIYNSPKSLPSDLSKRLDLKFLKDGDEKEASRIYDIYNE